MKEEAEDVTIKLCGANLSFTGTGDFPSVADDSVKKALPCGHSRDSLVKGNLTRTDEGDCAICLLHEELAELKVALEQVNGCLRDGSRNAAEAEPGPWAVYVRETDPETGEIAYKLVRGVLGSAMGSESGDGTISANQIEDLRTKYEAAVSELRAVDQALSGRPATAGLSRASAIEKACKAAQRSEDRANEAEHCLTRTKRELEEMASRCLQYRDLIVKVAHSDVNLDSTSGLHSVKVRVDEELWAEIQHTLLTM